MKRIEKGVFAVIVEEDLLNYYYEFKLNFADKVLLAIDPYAKAACPNGTLGCIVDFNEINESVAGFLTQ